jgi:hypothetical protein
MITEKNWFHLVVAGSNLVFIYKRPNARIFTCVVQLLKLQFCCTCTGSLIRPLLDKLQRVVDVLFLSDPFAGVLSH